MVFIENLIREKFNLRPNPVSPQTKGDKIDLDPIDDKNNIQKEE